MTTGRGRCFPDPRRAPVCGWRTPPAAGRWAQEKERGAACARPPAPYHRRRLRHPPHARSVRPACPRGPLRARRPGRGPAAPRRRGAARAGRQPVRPRPSRPTPGPASGRGSGGVGGGVALRRARVPLQRRTDAARVRPRLPLRVRRLLDVRRRGLVDPGRGRPLPHAHRPRRRRRARRGPLRGDVGGRRVAVQRRRADVGRGRAPGRRPRRVPGRHPRRDRPARRRGPRRRPEHGGRPRSSRPARRRGSGSGASSRGPRRRRGRTSTGWRRPPTGRSWRARATASAGPRTGAGRGSRAGSRASGSSTTSCSGPTARPGPAATSRPTGPSTASTAPATGAGRGTEPASPGSACRRSPWTRTAGGPRRPPHGRGQGRRPLALGRRGADVGGPSSPARRRPGSVRGPSSSRRSGTPGPSSPRRSRASGARPPGSTGGSGRAGSPPSGRAWAGWRRSGTGSSGARGTRPRSARASGPRSTPPPGWGGRAEGPVARGPGRPALPRVRAAGVLDGRRGPDVDRARGRGRDGRDPDGPPGHGRQHRRVGGAATRTARRPSSGATRRGRGRRPSGRGGAPADLLDLPDGTLLASVTPLPGAEAGVGVWRSGDDGLTWSRTLDVSAPGPRRRPGRDGLCGRGRRRLAVRRRRAGVDAGDGPVDGPPRRHARRRALRGEHVDRRGPLDRRRGHVGAGRRGAGRLARGGPPRRPGRGALPQRRGGRLAVRTGRRRGRRARRRGPGLRLAASPNPTRGPVRVRFRDGRGRAPSGSPSTTCSGGRWPCSETARSRPARTRPSSARPRWRPASTPSGSWPAGGCWPRPITVAR